MWSTNLKRNMGLIPDERSCKGASYPYTGEVDSCLCYDTKGAEDRASAKIDVAQAEYEAIEGHQFAVTTEEKAQQESDGLSTEPMRFEETGMALQAEEKGFRWNKAWSKRVQQWHNC
jgi:hypothetical protein